MNIIYLKQMSFFNIINVFTVTFDQFNASLLNKSINLNLSISHNALTSAGKIKLTKKKIIKQNKNKTNLLSPNLLTEIYLSIYLFMLALVH